MAEADETAPLVLVTGASGYLATHVIQQLQQAGTYRVRGTVRSLKNEEKVKPLRELCQEAKYEVELVEADLLNADCWDAAVAGCQYVLHVASPFPSEEPKDEQELIKPAVDGTLNVLKAAAQAGCVKRVVLTSSVASISGGFEGGERPYTEEDWTDVNAPGCMAYIKSKTLAEKAAWDFVKDHPDLELAVINPTYIMGPVLCGSFSTSMELPKRLLERQMPMIPRICFAIVDVRDVAEAHIKAMTSPDAMGKRHILDAGCFWFIDIAHILSEEFTQHGYSVPTTVAPNFAVKFLSMFDKTIRLIVPGLGKVTSYDNTRMREVLGIEPRAMKDTINFMAYSLIERGMVKKSSKYKGPPQAPEGSSTACVIS